jgi:hypothetical protein
MDRNHSPSGWRAAAFAVALFAITLNFLQPLAHAALMRDGGTTTWSSMCLAAAGQGDRRDSKPAATMAHECCLGLAHAPTLSAPPEAFLVVEPSPSIADRPLLASAAMAPVAIRDGPSQPRGPPSLT